MILVCDPESREPVVGRDQRAVPSRARRGRGDRGIPAAGRASAEASVVAARPRLGPDARPPQARLSRRTHSTLGYSSWGDYFEAEFGQRKSHAYRLLDSARVVRQLDSPIGERPNEAQARELAPLLEQPGRLQEAWTETIEKTNGHPTAARVRELLPASDPRVTESQARELAPLLEQPHALTTSAATRTLRPCEVTARILTVVYVARGPWAGAVTAVLGGRCAERRP